MLPDRGYMLDESMLDESIYHFRGVGSILSLSFIFNEKSCYLLMRVEKA